MQPLPQVSLVLIRTVSHLLGLLSAGVLSGGYRQVGYCHCASLVIQFLSRSSVRRLRG